ncbi:TolC family protein [Cetobacterium sp.]|uniref:TolC family protein n=1 Tax=Cetobacterium sp. TaxID=2071632 RepID=UPI003AF15093
MKKYLLLLLALNLVSFSMELTLDKSIDLAEQNNRQLQEKSIGVKQKKLNENIKIKNALPSFRAQTTYVDHDESKNLNSSFQNGVYLSQPIFTGGELYYNIKSSKALREFEEDDYIYQKINLKLEVIQAYINCLQLKKSLNIYEASQKEKQEELKKQQEFYNLSLIDRSEVLKIETSLYQTETSILKIKNNIISQELILKNLLGLDIDETITLKEMDFSRFITKNINLQKDTEKALTSGTLSKKLDKNILISEYDAKSKRSTFFPKVDLEYGYESLEESSFSRSNNDWEWRVGISFKWDIFNFGSGIDNYKESTLEIEKQKISKLDSLENLKREIKTAYLNLITAKETITTNEKALLTALETFNIDREKFSNRIIDSVDFLKSESQLREAQITHINSQLDYFLYYQQYLSLLK